MEVQLQAAWITAGAVVLGLVVQALLALRTLRQRRRSDDREARWARIQWAVDHVLGDDPAAQEVGAAALYAITDEPELEPRDREVVDAALSELEARKEDVLDALRQAALLDDLGLDDHGQDERGQDERGQDERGRDDGGDGRAEDGQEAGPG